MARQLLTAADFKATPIPQGLVAWWAGSYASIPAGWEIANGQVSSNDPTYTKPNLTDGRFPKGSDTAGSIGGSPQHTHDIPAHTHTLSGGGSCWSGTRWDDDPLARLSCSHTHTCGSSAATALVAASNEPAHMQVIPIVYTAKSGGTRGVLTPHDLMGDCFLPYKAILAFTDVTIPDGWALCDGSTVNGVATPNLLNKYLRGIANASVIPGNSYPGTPSHAHTVNHTHACSGADIGNERDVAGDGSWPLQHTHTISTDSVNSTTASTEPPYRTVKYLIFVGHGPVQKADPRGRVRSQDLSSTLLAPRGLILALTDTTDAAASGFAHCDGEAWINGQPTGYGASRPNLFSRFLKHVNGAVDGGTLGGSDQHAHTGGDHQHVSGGGTGTIQHANHYKGTWTAAPGHTHTLTTITWSGNASGYSTNMQDNKPPYVEVAWMVRD